MVDTAAKNECDLDFRFSGGDGEKLEARLTHADADATKIKTAEKAHRKKPTAKGVAVADITAFAEEIERLEPGSLDAAHVLITAIVRLLHQTNNEYLVEKLARELESRGQSQWAEEVRKIARRQHT